MPPSPTTMRSIVLLSGFISTVETLPILLSSLPKTGEPLTCETSSIVSGFATGLDGCAAGCDVIGGGPGVLTGPPVEGDCASAGPASKARAEAIVMTRICTPSLAAIAHLTSDTVERNGITRRGALGSRTNRARCRRLVGEALDRRLRKSRAFRDAAVLRAAMCDTVIDPGHPRLLALAYQ